ncbi:hypothetical protein [Bradyrhizobium ivorense]|uniref:hypothetical protein n=1 Tax=Bradyrhizobium ivorense TaxID=2511166 RepID=UPI001116069A|nr:hypothetical protein [Bradyrhizobium ivorense]
MLDALAGIGAGWRALVHISAWSGLSVGAILGLAVLVYFDPKALKAAIAGGVAVAIAWAAIVHGHSVGVADEDARLQTISNRNDARAGAAASADETALVRAIESKAKDQHNADLAGIARLKAAGASCAFDPDSGDASGVLARPGQAGAGAVDGKAQPAGNAGAPDKGAAGASSRRGLPFPLVSGAGLPRKGHGGNAAPDG